MRNSCKDKRYDAKSAARQEERKKLPAPGEKPQASALGTGTRESVPSLKKGGFPGMNPASREF
jgi:hypothetical protein